MTCTRLSALMMGAAVAALPLLCGCEDATTQANRRVSESTAAAQAAAVKGAGRPDAPAGGVARPAGYKELEAAAKEVAASLEVKATAKGALAESNYGSGVALFTQISHLETEAQGKLRTIALMGNVIGTDNRASKAMKASNPSVDATSPLPVFKGMQEKLLAEAAGYEKKIKELEGLRDTTAGKIKELEGQVSAANAQAADLVDKSERAKGEDSVALFKQAMGSRKNAGVLANQVDLTRLELARLNAQIADVTKAKASAESGAATIASQIKAINDAWTATRGQIEKRSANSQDVLTKGSIDALAKELAALEAQADQARTLATETYLIAAAGGYKDAAALAVQFVGELGKKKSAANGVQNHPLVPVWDKLEKLQHPHRYKIGEARAHQARGKLFMQQKMLLESHKRIGDAAAAQLVAAGLKAPEELAPASLADQIRTAGDNAKKEFEAASAIATDIFDRPQGSDQVIAARQVELGVRYSLYQMDGVMTNLAAAASQFKALALEEGLVMPAFATDVEANTLKRQPVTPSGGTPVPPKSTPTPPVTNPSTPAATTDTPTPPATPAADGTKPPESKTGFLGKAFNRAAGAFGKSGAQPPEKAPEPNK
jgi:hypothetical protein